MCTRTGMMTGIMTTRTRTYRRISGTPTNMPTQPPPTPTRINLTCTTGTPTRKQATYREIIDHSTAMVSVVSVTNPSGSSDRWYSAHCAAPS